MNCPCSRSDGNLNRELEDYFAGVESEVDRSDANYTRWIQRGLNRIISAGLTEDGIPGRNTRSAVIRFQRQAGLTPDGIVGVQTEAALVRAGAGDPPGSGSGAGGSYVPAFPPSGPSGSSALPPGSGSMDIVNVGGIQVARSIADDVSRLLKAAAADGIQLSGSGWRNPEDQIRLRKQNCGTSRYAIYDMPSSQCTPPTARPGTSNHERGLAIDFRYNGLSITTHDNPGYRWLQANAKQFGLENYSREPWHWSVDGR